MSAPDPRPRSWHPGGPTGLRAVLGALVWVALATGGGAAVWRWHTDAIADPATLGPTELVTTLVEHGRQRGRELELHFAEPRRSRVGDPIFVADAPGRFDQVGVIVGLDDADGRVTGPRARSGVAAIGGRALLYAAAPPLGGRSYLVHYRADESLLWVVRTLLPPAKQARIRLAIRTALDQHGEAIREAMLPIVADSLRAAFAAVERELPEVIAAHRDQLQQLGMDYQDEIVRGELLPVIRTRILPIAERRAGPLVRSIGREIWERVSLWRIGSRYVWDLLPLTGGESLETEWTRIVQNEALPILERRSPEILAVLSEIATEAAKDPEVQATVRRAAGVLADDGRLHALIWSMFRSAVLENRALRQALAEHWRSPRAQDAIAAATARLEPTFARIGDTILGTRRDGISPEFAQVLRNRVLLKDRQWYVLVPAGDATATTADALVVHPGDSPPPEDQDPFVPEDGR